MPQADFSGCYARLDGADEAMGLFFHETESWLAENDVTETTVEYHAEADVHVFRLIGRMPPLRLGVVISNAIHQLRAALDGMVWQVVLADGGIPAGGPSGNAFPIFVLPDSRGRTFANRAGSRLQGMSPAHTALIESLQPYQRPSGRDPAGQHPLGLLSRLSNRDKHQVLESVAAGQHSTADWAFQVVNEHDEPVVASRGFLMPVRTLDRGAVIACAHLDPPGVPYDNLQLVLVMFLRMMMRLPADELGPEVLLAIGPELRFISANVRAILDGFAPIGREEEAKAVSFDIDDLSARYAAHFRASPEYPGYDEPPRLNLPGTPAG